MRSIYSSSDEWVELSENYNLKEPRTEAEILDFQEQFLTNGFHYIKVDTIQQGRSLICTYLHSLNAHHDIACLTLVDEQLPQNVTNLFDTLIQNGYLDSHKPKSTYLDEFFIEHFYYDFLWIEITEQSQVIEDIRRKIIDCNLDQSIPIFVIMMLDTKYLNFR